MGKISTIGWTNATYNHWIGCTKVGPGCDHCYAEVWDQRFSGGGHWGAGAPRRLTAESNRQNPYRWNRWAEKAGRPMRVFSSSLADVFDNEVPDEWRSDLFARWRDTPWLRWIVLTKRIGNAAKMLPADWGAGYPNVGIMATVVNQEEYDRDAPKLMDVPARWHGFSMEPQIGRIYLNPRLTVNRGSIWVIMGGESRQPGHPDIRPWNPDWVSSTVAMRRSAHHLRVFVKQTGAAPIGMTPPKDGAGADPTAWPLSIRMQEFPPEVLV
jgi:protein gp37